MNGLPEFAVVNIKAKKYINTKWCKAKVFVSPAN